MTPFFNYPSTSKQLRSSTLPSNRASGEMIIFQVKTETSPENQTELLQTLETLVGPIRSEEGCAGFSILNDVVADNKYIIEEKWKAEKDLTRHFKSENFGLLMGALSCLCETDKLEFITLSTVRRVGDLNQFS